VDPGPEGQMPVVRPPQVEPVRVGEHLRVVVGGAAQHDDLVPPPDEVVPQGYVGECGPHGELDGES
jgi:hypothetical protein